MGKKDVAGTGVGWGGEWLIEEEEGTLKITCPHDGMVVFKLSCRLVIHGMLKANV